MNSFRLPGVLCGGLLICANHLCAQTGAGNFGQGGVRLVAIEGTLELIRAGAALGVKTEQTNQILNPGDRLRTGPNSRVVLRWSDQSVVRLKADTFVEILPPRASQDQSGLHILKGLISFFHRDEPKRIQIVSPGLTAGIKGTEFVVAVESVNNEETTTLYLIDGEVEASNPQGSRTITNMQQAVAAVGKAPVVRSPGFIANNVLQWCFYYPAVLDLRDLPLTPPEELILGESLASYRAGHLLAALAKYPSGRQPGSDAERIYYAALLLSVGQVEQTQDVLAALPAGDPSAPLQRLANALRQLIAAVKLQPAPSTIEPRLSTEFLASSYYAQSRAVGDVTLKRGLDLAREAATISPEFSFAWARVAELEFSFGRMRRALDALNRSLVLSPSNAQALTLKGFLLAAENKTRESIDWFDRAIAVDSALGNAWLGRGLCKIRLTSSFFSLSSRERAGVRAEGEPGTRNSKLETSGFEDLLMAAALEPQRALLRSYLGKAYDHTGDSLRALHELDLAKHLDAADPTPWLYSALANRQDNLINDSVRELERSVERNENRRLYRSELLLDQDRAVRGANLASSYRDAGMFDWSVRQASRAVNSDYANASAHLFLANSYNELRDPNLINLRYETVTFSEYLMANLLAPVGATPLSPSVSQQEYSRLFERDRPGISSATTYFSSGDWQQSGSQYGTFGDLGYAVDATYRSQSGERPNNDLEQLALSAQFKVQLTPQDSVYLQGIYSDFTSGDVRQYYNHDGTIPNVPGPSSGLRVHEVQEPNLFAGLHHEWSPGSHTLLLAGRLNDCFTLSEPNAAIQTIIRDPNGVATNTFNSICRQLSGADCAPFSLAYDSVFDAYSAEIQQVFQGPKHTWVAGGRFQTGEIETQSVLNRPPAYPPVYDPLPFAQKTTADLERLSLYGYCYWRLCDAVWLTAGVSYDRLNYPRNIDLPPISEQQTDTDRVSPKVGIQWQPGDATTLRGAYTRSLGGLFYDASIRLEPTQIAGFNQAFRSLIPESVEGAIAGTRFETFGVGVDQRFKSGTYLTVEAQLLRSDAERTVGVYDYVNVTPYTAVNSGARQEIAFDEPSLSFSLNQLVGKEWSLGLRYKVSEARLRSDYPDLPDTVIPDERNRAVLHQLNLFAIYTHSSGFFAEAQSLWSVQSNFGYSPDLPGADFWQFNVFAGYRFARRRAELTLGLLNITSQDYHLNPLNLYLELPRQRTLLASLKFNF